MKKIYQQRGNILFALNIFALFLLLFERSLMIPLWLQPIGRMHPLILHFPIVLLLLSMVMEFFMAGRSREGNSWYHAIGSDLLFTGAFFAGLTAVMGIFLAQEEGYDRGSLVWHRWFGASVFFLASLAWMVKNSKQNVSPILTRVASVMIALIIVGTGHFGSILTHGEDFIWSPVITMTPDVAPEEALVFEHAVKPVLERKCLSCHNEGKAKGKLVLTDTASLLRGGKSGALFVANRPDSSLIFERITLPVDDEKHMPPSGKSQLTKAEKDLIKGWIEHGGRFDTQLTSLPVSSPLRKVATSILWPDNDTEQFDFPAASESALRRLNSDFRTVSPLHVSSPALTVNIFSRASYKREMLDELREVSQQIVSLDLSKMPVTDEDLEYVSRFRNLRRLNLNFTNITGEGIRELTALSQLEHLSLSGTQIGSDDLYAHLPRFKSLTSLAIWNTQVSAVQLNQLRADFRNITFSYGIPEESMPLIRLNKPVLKNKSVVFKDSLLLDIYHPVPNCEIRISTSEQEPDSVSSTLYQKQIIVSRTGTVLARAFKKGWIGSETAKLNVYRRAYQPDTAWLLTKLNKVHTANGANTFFDSQLGTFNANSPAWANNWAGFIRNDMELMLHFKEPQRISSVSLNCLIETENVIFPPSSIEVWGGTTSTDLRLLTIFKPETPMQYRKPYIELFTTNFTGRDFRYLKIIAKPYFRLPSWHKNKSRTGLLLIDEILVN